MAPKFVIPYLLSGRRGKNDAADAAAICEAVIRPNMRFVPIKSIEQQGQLMVHRARQGFVEQRTATFNRIRDLHSELGIVLALKPAVVRREAMARLEDLPDWANTVVGDLLSEVTNCWLRRNECACKQANSCEGGEKGLRATQKQGPVAGKMAAFALSANGGPIALTN